MHGFGRGRRQVGDQFAGGLIPFFRRLGHHFLNGGRDTARHSGTQLLHRYRFGLLVAEQFLRQRAVGEWRTARQQEIERAAQAVNVRPDVGFVKIQGLLGRHVIEGAHRHGVIGSQVAGHFAVGGPVEPGQTQIEDLDHARRLWPLRYQQIGRLDVPMNQVSLVDVLKPQRSLANVVACLFHGKRAMLANQTGQVGPLDVLHRQEIVFSHGAGVISVDHVRMCQAADELNFPVESANDFTIGQQVTANQLEGDNAVHVQVPGFEDLPGAAFAKSLQQEVMPDRQFGAAAENELVDLIRSHPTALEQTATSAHVRRISAQLIGKLGLLVSRQERGFLQRLGEGTEGINRHKGSLKRFGRGIFYLSRPTKAVNKPNSAFEQAGCKREKADLPVRMDAAVLGKAASIRTGRSTQHPLRCRAAVPHARSKELHPLEPGQGTRFL